MFKPIYPNWPVSNSVHALCTTRQGGVSVGPFASLNLATHVNDNPEAVEHNRERLIQALDLPEPPRYLHQVHSTHVVQAEQIQPESAADAVISAQVGIVCAIMSADCLPVLLCEPSGQEIAAIHAGWRGLVHGIIQNTISAMQTPAKQLLAWLGPAISQAHYEVGPEVAAACLDCHPDAHSALKPSHRGHYLLNLADLAHLLLQALGVTHIYGGEYCTYAQNDLFFSYRRAATTGRMASLIWLTT